MSNEIKREPETLPARMYYEDAYWELDRTRIWSRAWVLAGLVSDFAKTGDYVSTTVAGYPVMVVKGEDGAIRAFHNVCRHRASPLVREPQGHIDKLLCPYHSWRYAFDGKLLNAPSMRCEKSEFSLFPVRCESWRGLVFVCLSKDAPPVAEWLKDLAGSALRYPLEKMKLARKFTVSGDVNWKTYGDNYAEAWHVPTIHPGLNASIDMAGYKIEAVGDSLQIHSAPAKDGGITDGLWVWKMPGLFVNMYNWGMNVAQLEPLGPRKMRLTYRYLLTDMDAIAAKVRDELIDWGYMIAKEDLEICAQVQANLEAGIYDTGRLSLVFENGVIQFQDMVRAAYREATSIAAE